MKKIGKSLMLIIIITSLWSCTQTPEEIEYIRLTPEDVKNKIIMLESPAEIHLNVDTANTNVTAFYLFGDTCILTQNSYISDSFLDLYSLKDKNRIARLAPKGRGPGEFTQCNAIVHSSALGRFYISDGRNFYFVNTDSTLINKKLKVLNSFKYSNPDLHPYMDVCPVDSLSYVGYNLWYIDNPEYNPGHIPELTKFYIHKQTGPSDAVRTMFPGPVNGASLFVSPDHNRIWVADWHKNIIKICDTALNVVKRISGPGADKVPYSSVEANNDLKMIVFPNNTIYKAYAGFTYTPEYVYIINEGVEGMDNQIYEKEKLPPVKIYKFSWDGRLQSIYRPDKYISAISVSSDGKRLYCTSKDTLYGEARLIVYNI